MGAEDVLDGSSRSAWSRDLDACPASPVLHVLPPHPGGQAHRNASPWSKHVPPLLQVVASHWLSPGGIKATIHHTRDPDATSSKQAGVEYKRAH